VRIIKKILKITPLFKCYVTFIHSSRWQQNHINHIAQLFYHCRLQKKIVNIVILQES